MSRNDFAESKTNSHVSFMSNLIFDGCGKIFRSISHEIDTVHISISKIIKANLTLFNELHNKHRQQFTQKRIPKATNLHKCNKKRPLQLHRAAIAN